MQDHLTGAKPGSRSFLSLRTVRRKHIYFEKSFAYSVSVVSEIMPQKVVVTVDIKDNPSALDVAKLMAKHRIGSVLVIEGYNKEGLCPEQACGSSCRQAYYVISACYSQVH